MKNGENTPIAISLVSGGMCARIGRATKSSSIEGPGQMASMPVVTMRP